MLAPPSGQEFVVADLNESGLQTKTDGGREEVENKKRDEEKRGAEGRENKLNIREEKHFLATFLHIPTFPSTLLSSPCFVDISPISLFPSVRLSCSVTY